MYRREVPKYAVLQDLVENVNASVLVEAPGQLAQMRRMGDLHRLGLERHGAVRLGTAGELATMRRIFAVMGMFPVGYYDLSVAGMPVHSTAFRPITDEALAANPFRVFTSLLRLELLDDPVLSARARDILHGRNIFRRRALELLARFEDTGGLTSDEADDFVSQVLETFRWHGRATVTAATYASLQGAHRLVADVVCFPGPHINHLTPRTLDIDALQAQMPGRGLDAKQVIEGPPRRKHPILLRQTSFKALEEPVTFVDGQSVGTHSARFGEVEQRGVALTRAGRTLYDGLLARVRQAEGDQPIGMGYADRLATAFESFPDDLDELRRRDLAFFRYRLKGDEVGRMTSEAAGLPLQALIDREWVAADPITYEDFLPVSAAGIFQSNLGGEQQCSVDARGAKEAFERALGAPVHDEIALYEAARRRSIDAVRSQLRLLGST